MSKQTFTPCLKRSGILPKLIFTLILTLLWISLLAACSAPSATQQSASTTAQKTTSATEITTPKSGGVLKIVPRTSAANFGYPSDLTSAGFAECAYPCLESLCGVDSQGFFLPTRLSTDFEAASDGKSVTLTLRQGVKFHDGSDFNAQAAKWNLEIVKKARFPGTETWTSIDVVDAYVIRINFTKYQNTLIANLANDYRICSQSAVEKNGVEWAHTHPVGTGPFKFVSFTPDVGIEYDRFDAYWGGKPLLDGIEMVYMTDDMARSAAIQSGGVDVLSNVTAETGIALLKKGYNVNSVTTGQLIAWVPDSANPSSPLSNLKVRQAMEYAIDRNAIAELGNGLWTAVNQPTTANTPGYMSNFEGRSYNPDIAKQLLAEAGYPNGFDMKFIYSQGASMPGDVPVACQNYLGKVGIKAELQGMSKNQKDEYVMNGWQNGSVNIGLYTGSMFISACTRAFTPNGTMYVSADKPAEVTDLLSQAAAAIDPEDIEKFNRQLVMFLYDNATLLPIFSASQSVYVMQPYVHDIGFEGKNSLSDWSPEKAWLDK